MTVSFARMTLQGGVAVLLASLLRTVLRDRLPRRAMVWLWAAALARLLLPLGLPLYARPAPASVHVSGIVVAVSGGAGQSVPASGAFPVLRFLWLAVAALLGAWFALGHIRARRLLNTGTVVKTALPTLSRPLRRRVTVRTVRGLPTPVAYGVLRPTIVMPADADLNAPASQYAMLHELCHIRRFDTVLKGLAALALCLHWFNPVVWLLYALLGRDMELACDEAALSELGGDARRAYALALLHFRSKRDGLTPGPVAFGGIADEERIRCVMKFQKKTVLTLVLSLALVAAFVLTAFAAGTTQPETPETEPPATETGEGAGTALPGFGGIVTDGASPDPEGNPGQVKLYVIQINPDGTQEPVLVEPELSDGHQVWVSVDRGDFLTERENGLYVMGYKLLSVSRSDESQFTPDQWTTVLRAIENGTVTWND